MVIIDIKSKEKFEIEPKKSGQNYTTCPACSAERKHKNAKSFSWNNNEGVGYCHNCDRTFGVMREEIKPVEYKFPAPIIEAKAYSQNMAAFFMNRGLFESTMKRFKISEGEHYFPQIEKKRNAIMFPYYRDGKLINVKYRDGEKNFSLTSGAELILFNIDSIQKNTTVIITEGEFDCMAIEQVGFSYVVSVPNGASKSLNNLKYLDNCIDYFENIDRIIIATDKDDPGVNLRTQLAARLGVDRCYKVEFGDCKDANEVLIKHGSDKLKEIINSAAPFPIDGAFTVIDIEEELNNLFVNGLKKGFTIGMPDFDKLISFEFGRLYTVTGIPSHGKSKFVDFIISRLNLMYKMKAAFFSPETFPIELHTAAISELLTGRKFGQNTMTNDEYYQAKKHINEQFYWIMPEDSFTLDNILSKARQLVLRKGVQILVIDPYNKLEHQTSPGENETQYISRFLDTLVNFAHKNNIILFLVAHPKKMQKNNGVYEMPTLYDINGSANFFNKTDFGITVYRDFENQYITTHVNKVKFKHLGEVGNCEWKYNVDNNRFSEFSFPNGTVIHDNVNWLEDGFLSPELVNKSMPISTQFPVKPNKSDDTPF